ncbi:MAG: type III pantothenate kinase [Planctomycetaceae bacterium]|nr:type III pantothenate kinase [Planctomycetaceae bacterium]
MSIHILAIDAGNTQIKLGICRNISSETSQLPECEGVLVARRDENLPWDVLRRQLENEKNVRAIVTGSHPSTVRRLLEEWPEDLPPLHGLLDRSRLPIRLDVEFPDRVGIDRLLSCIAANALRPANRPAIVVDTGTAVTVNAVSMEGTFCGGAILPGLGLSARALHQYTALLPELDWQQLLVHEPDVVGRHTEAAIASGLYWGLRGSVRELVDQMGRELGEQAESPLVVLTGGAARVWTHNLPDRWIYEPHLTLKGIAVAAMNVPELFGPSS